MAFLQTALRYYALDPIPMMHRLVPGAGIVWVCTETPNGYCLGSPSHRPGEAISADEAFHGDHSLELLLQNRARQAQATFGPHSHHTCSRSASRSSYSPSSPTAVGSCGKFSVARVECLCRNLVTILTTKPIMHVSSHAAYNPLLGRQGTTDDCDTFSSSIPSLRTAPHACILPVQPIQWSRLPTA